MHLKDYYEGAAHRASMAKAKIEVRCRKSSSGMNWHYWRLLHISFINAVASQQDLSDAKAHVGIFSTHGVNESRRLFWTRFNQGT